MDFLEYAYLQSGQEAKARMIFEQVKQVPGWEHGHDEDVASQQTYFASRNALDLHRWKEAASLPVPAIRLTWQDTVYWVRAIGAARSGDVDGARSDVKKLAKIVTAREADQRKKGNRVREGKATDLSEAEAWLAYAEGKTDEAIQELRSAAERQEAEYVDLTWMPAREMLADMLLEAKRPSKALVEYQAVLRESRNRFDALYGGARAAEAAGNLHEALQFYADLLKISPSDADRPELTEARERTANARK
jgi:tetratricopeptide (TPR) repeat protein